MGERKNSIMRNRIRNRKLIYCFFILIAILLLDCSAIKFLNKPTETILQSQSKRFEFEAMQVIDGPAVLVSDDGQYLSFWSWGTVRLDLSNEAIRDTVRLSCMLREDFAGTEHACFRIKVPHKNGTGEGIYYIDSEAFQIYEMRFTDVVPGIWEFSFTNDYPQERNLHADYVIFEWDTVKVIDSIRTDTLYCADLDLPKKVTAVWDKNKEADLRNYVAYFNDVPFHNTYQVSDSVVTVDTFAVFNTSWLELYARVIAIDTADNRSGFSEMVRGLILPMPQQENKGDWNRNGKIDFDDLVRFCSPGVYGAMQGDPNYENVFDFDDSGKVGFDDLVTFCQVYGTIFVTNLNISIH